MPSLIFDTCCCCVELRIGCLILGYIQLVGEVISLAVLLLILFGAGVETATENDEEVQTGGAGMIFLLILIILFILVEIGITSLLLVGIHKNKRGFIKAYLIIATVGVGIILLGIIVNAFSGGDAGDVFGGLVNLCVISYFVLVIRSYYLKMDEMKPSAYDAA